MKNIKLLFLFICWLTVTSCARKEVSSSRVTIDTSKLFSSKVTTQASVITGAGAGEPNWGLSAPGSLADVGCIGVMVGGPEPELNSSSCTNLMGTKMATFGIRAGLFDKDSEWSFEVPAGPGRRFYLFAMRSADGTCEETFADDPEINVSNYSRPYVIGYAEKNLVKAQEEVRIVINDSFAAQAGVQTCDFFKPGGGSPSLSLAFQGSYDREIWASENDYPRNVIINHNGDSIQCSRDAGGSYGACDGPNNLVWDKNDYIVEHRVQVLNSDGLVLTEQAFTPSVEYPGLLFRNCNVTIPSNQSGFSSVNSFMSIDNNTLCIADATINVDNSSDYLDMIGNNTAVVFLQGSSGQIVQAVNNDFDLIGVQGDNIKIIGANIVSNADGAYSAIYLDGSRNPLITDSQITMTGYGAAIKIDTGATGVSLIERTEISSPLGGFTIEAFNNSVAHFTHSKIQGTDYVIQATLGAQVNFFNSILENISTEDTTKHLVVVNNAGHVSVNDSIMIDRAGGANKISGVGNASIELNNTVHVHAATAQDNVDVFNISGSGTKAILSSTDGNLFCNQDGASRTLANILDGNQAAGGLDPLTQLNPAPLGTVVFPDCPQAILDLL